MKFIVPGHKYLGPGNKLKSGKPTNSADRIARHHDYEYDRAYNSSHIRKSDNKAIVRFAQDFAKNRNYGSALGALGLTAKSGFERLTNKVIYPNISGMSKPKNWWRFKYGDNYKDRIAAKRRRLNLPEEESPDEPDIEQDAPPEENDEENPMDDDHSNESMDVGAGPSDETIARVPRAANGPTGGHGSGGGMRGAAPLYKSISTCPQHLSHTFQKQYLLRISNGAVRVFFYEVNDYEKGHYVAYPYHDLPVALLGFYLSEEEIRVFRNKTRARVKHCKVEVDTKTAVLKFETNAATTAIGNNNLGIYFRDHYGKQLAHDRNGYFVNDTGTAGRDQPELIRNIFWGTHLQALGGVDTTNLSGVSAQVIRRNFSNKFAYRSVGDGGVNNQGTGVQTVFYSDTFFPLNNYANNRINASMTEGPFTSWEYTPRNGLFHESSWNHRIEGPRTEVTEGAGPYLLPQRTGVTSWGYNHGNDNDGIHNHDGAKMAALDTAGETLVMGRNMSAVITRGLLSAIPIENPNIAGASQQPIPCLTIGIEPELSVINNDGAPEVVNCHVDIIVTTSITIDWSEGVYYRYRDGGNLTVPDNMHATMARNYKIINATGASVHPIMPDFGSRGMHREMQTINVPNAQALPGDSNWAVAPRPAISDEKTMYDPYEEYKEYVKVRGETRKEGSLDRNAKKHHEYNLRHLKKKKENIV